MHFTEGVRSEKALAYALRAARACKAEFAYESALRFYEYLLRQKPRWTEERQCELSIEAAIIYTDTGSPGIAIQILERNLRKILGKNKSYLSVQLHIQLSRSYQYLGDIRKSEWAAKCGLKILHNLSYTFNWKEAEISLLSQIAFCLLHDSKCLEGIALLKKYASYSSMPNQSMDFGHLQILISALYGAASNYRDGMKSAQIAISVLEPLGAVHLLPIAYSHLGVSYVGRGRFGQALSEFQRAVSTGKRARSPYLLAQALCNLTECLCRSGQFALAAERMMEVIKITSETGNPVLASAGILCMLENQIAICDWCSALKTRDLLNNIDSLPVYLRAQAFLFTATLQAELGLFKEAHSSLEKLDQLVTPANPIYEAKMGQIIKARILFYEDRIAEATEVLSALEKEACINHWPYLMTLTKLFLSEIMIDSGNWYASKSKLRQTSRIARIMPAIHLGARSHLFLGKALVLQAKEANKNKDATKNVVANDLLDNARIEFQRAVELCIDGKMIEISWQAHYALMSLFWLKNDDDRALAEAQQTLIDLEKLEAMIPAESLPICARSKERSIAREECRKIVRNCLGNQTFLSIEEIEQEQLRALFRIGSAINSIRDVDTLLNTILNLFVNTIGADRAVISLAEGYGNHLRSIENGVFSDPKAKLQDDIARKIMKNVMESGAPFITTDAACDPRCGRDVSSDSKLILCGLLHGPERKIGVLYADKKRPTDKLNETTFNFFKALCNIAAVAIDNAFVHCQLIREKRELEEYLQLSQDNIPEIVGKSRIVDILKERIRLAAKSPLDVLISGESGTGKELVARALHRIGRRASEKFVAIDCGALSDFLIESELFGFKKGAFTGALESRSGLLEDANGGVVFLDEISNLPLRLQKKLLRVIQEREVRRIGETVVRKINVQIVAASNRDLRHEAGQGKFRKDLYYRLNAMEIVIPPLRERQEDIPLLIEWFMDHITKKEGGMFKVLSADALVLLRRYTYPGNVRELKNIVEGAFYSTNSNIITIEQLPIKHYIENHQSSLDIPQLSSKIYERIKQGDGNFDQLIKKPFIKRQIDARIVRGVIQYALVDSRGKYRESLKMLGIPQEEYAVFLQFLKRNECYIDYRSFRRNK